MADMLRHSQCKILPCLAALISTAGKRTNVATRCPVSHLACRPQLKMSAAVAPMRTAGNKAFCDGLLLEMSAVVAAHGWRYQLSPATHSWPCICCGQPLLEMSTVAAAHYWRFQCSHGFPLLEISCHGCRPLEMPPLLGLSKIMAIDCLCQLSLPPTVRDF
jgi:hypothetical protein